MALKNLYDDTTSSDVAGDTENIPSIQGNPTGLFQAKIAGTATVTLQGRLVDDDTKADWEDVYELTASGAQQVALFPFMRVNNTGVSGSTTISAYLHT